MTPLRKAPPESAPVPEKWALPFAGFLLLVVAVFAVLYVRSQAEADRLAGGKGPPPARQTHVRSPSVPPGSSAACSSSANPPLPLSSAPSLPAPPSADLRELRTSLLGGLSNDSGEKRVNSPLEIHYDRRGLVVRLAAVSFFDDGRATVRPELRPLLDRVGRALAGTRRQVRVEGHTDVAEEGRGPYPSGWELSQARASWVLRYWVARYGLDPRLLGAVGFSHFRPLSRGTDAWSRGLNRRIEVVVLAEQGPADQEGE